MAAVRSPAVEALDRFEEEKKRLEQKHREARKAAAVELGEVVLATGAGRLPTAQLKAILTAAVALGGDQAVAKLGGAVPGRREAEGERQASNKPRSNGAGNSDGEQAGGHA